ncbi:glycosyltransferase family 4 protein [Pedobacter cryophilus]|uniref:Glycosyltransferase family 4 protein n=2 Tax=Pedobacter cryophilus TaxID=2571271 RepID=A0A4V5NY50_9SPHI|nr:glycosyltransferase family 4 protein [Pedobacter cryophilus]
MKRLFFPFGIIAMRNLKIPNEIDILLISTTHAGKYINVSDRTIVITYCYTPFRLVWSPNSYSEYVDSKGVKKWIFNLVIKLIKKIDFKAAQRTDYFIAMTEETKQRIKDSYHPRNEIIIIKPPVNIGNFYISPKQGNYYLLVSRLEFYKKVDLVIKAFNVLGFKLIVVGKGSKENELKELANENIEFKHGLSSEDLASIYSEAKAFIFPQHEDYGITPLEANASGRPVIAYGKGGVLDTMIPYTDDAKKATALFFMDQEVESLINAVRKFESLKFDSNFIRRHAENFDEPIFISKIRNFIDAKYKASLDK